MLLQQALTQAISQVPPGPWAAAVSGGADSVAMLLLLVGRSDLQITVVHLDHETRAGQSKRDAQFVQQLCADLRLPLVSAQRSDLEHDGLPANMQARYRALRLELYRRAIAAHKLRGVLQAHHADDQAETVLLRLMRGGGIEGLAGIRRESVVEGIRILRPLLEVRRQDLREFLNSRQQFWREDQSNASPKYQRNRARMLLQRRDDLVASLLAVGKDFARLDDVLERQAAALPDSPSLAELRGLEPLVLLHALRQWCLRQGTLADDLGLEHLDRLVNMVQDAAAGPSVPLPGNVEVRRRSGHLVMVHRAQQR